ncbi:TGM1 [Acanthosepion pharaonis]|uniref:TGM1 n=1 Tax=Acanthosepion pharaonis TaxID=158019 RepID=A0A812EDS0_ACAPH|nr:TGM1 [Sepia pharaonis]
MCDQSANPPKKHCSLISGGQRPQQTLKEKISDEEFQKKDANLQNSKSKYAETLKVQSVDFHNKSNREKHHTDEYEQKDLIVRRGTPFYLSFTFQQNIQPDRDLILLQLVTGNRPQQSKNTINRLTVLSPPKYESNEFRQLWKAKYVELKGNTIKIEVTPTANVLVGVYKVYLETKNINDPEDTPERYQLQDKIYVLFNPWCKDDTVYMEDEKDRDEYILNETGLIWAGSVNSMQTLHWNFGQFDEPCLDAALLLLKTGALTENGYKNPISVIRCLSAIVNSNGDDNGLLEGRWTENYPKDTTDPKTWTGSVAILKEYMDTRKTVRYGQCRVFAGVMTTLLRALGIPTRPVTNYESAYDKDNSMTIDFHFDEEGHPVKHLNDAVWDFHVWNESWLKRTDLPAGYDGWQAHDATPQQNSESTKHCGPAPLKAIKEGQVYLLYDVSFIFAEVNGDRVYWLVSKNNEISYMSKSMYGIGRRISTKAVGSDERHDITNLYKYREGSQEERRVVKFANQFSTRADDDIYKTDIVKDVDFKFEPPTTTEVGEGFEIKLKMTSLSDSVRKIDVVCPKEMKKDNEAKMRISFTNPLSLNLTNVVLNVEGSKIVASTTFREEIVPPKGKLVKEVTLHPKTTGYKHIIASLVSDQLKGIGGLAYVHYSCDLGVVLHSLCPYPPAFLYLLLTHRH